MINDRGPPTLFVTLNPSDVDHPIVRLLTGEDIDLNDISRGEDLSKWQRSLLAAKNPAACARFFHLMISAFISIILRYGRDSPGVYGTCGAYYGTVEAQGKGTLHCHMLIWLDGHLSPQLLREKLAGDEDYQKKLFEWLESIIQCQFPNSSGVESQRRSYPRRILCRETGDPHPGVLSLPSIKNKPISVFWREYIYVLERIVFQYSWHEHQTTCWKYLERGQEKNDANCRMGMNGETQEITFFDLDTQSVVLRRHHPKIASYTDIVSFLMQCNMDVKFVGSGEMAKAFTYYVTDYITKGSLSVHAGMAALSYAVSKIYSRNPLDGQDITDYGAMSAVITSVNSMMGRQEISQPQVMSYLLGGGDYYTSHKFAVLQWGETRGVVMKYEQAGTRNDATSGDNFLSALLEHSVMINLGRKAINVNSSSHLLDYVMRSSQTDFPVLCLYDFVAWTSKVTSPNQNAQDHPGCFSNKEHPQFYTHYIIFRRERRVPVLLGPKISNPTKSVETKEEWSRDMLVLFKPWRTISDLKDPSETWELAFNTYNPKLSAEHRRIISNMQTSTECRDARDRHRGQRSQETRYEEWMDKNVNVGDGLDGCIDASEDCILDPQEQSAIMEVDRNPFQDLDEEVSNGDSTRAQQSEVSYDDILSETASRLLDICLPVKMEDMIRSEDVHMVPTAVSPEDVVEIECHQNFMREQKKRHRVVGDEQGDLDERCATRPRHEHSDPIAERVTLKERSTDNTSIEWQTTVADDICVEMGLVNNAEQLKAFRLIARSVLAHTGEQLLMHVSGVGGTGKSHLIKAIVKLHERTGKRHELLLGAPTGIAAVLINGQTLHSLIMATPSNTKHTSDVNSLVQVWRYIKTLIIDETSMVGAAFLSDLSGKMRKGKGDDIVNSAKPFGGVNVIFMGDFGQLKPPKQYALYARELVKNPSFAEGRNQNGVSAMNGAFLWRQVRTVVELVKNERNSGDPEYASFLSRLRVGACLRPRNDGPSDLDYIMTRLMENQVSNVSVMEEFRDAPIIVGIKSLRDLLNVKLVKYHARRQGKQIGIYYSQDRADRKNVRGRIQSMLWNLPSKVNSEAFGRLPLFIGMKVMVTENLAFHHGIVNGSEGIVEDVKYEEDEQGRRYCKVVYVRVPGCGMRVNGLPDDVVPIFPVSTRIRHGIDSPKIKFKTFTRKQVPLVPAYVFTDFKSQGRTLVRAIVDLESANKGQGVYVMLSRVKSLSGLLILRWFSPNKVYRRLPEELRDELSRLQELSDQTSL